MLAVWCGGTRSAALVRGGMLYMWGGVGIVGDSELFGRAALRFGGLQLDSQLGGVYPSEAPPAHWSQRMAALWAELTVSETHAKADLFPPDLLNAAQRCV